MKIAVVCDVLGEENNGTSIAAMNLIRYLKSAGHEVRVVCADENRRGEENYYVMPSKHFGKFLDGLVDKVGVVIAKYEEEMMEKALNGVEFIHCLLPFSLGHHALNYAKKHNLPVTASFHMQAENFTSYLKLDKATFLPAVIYKTLYRTFFSKVDAIHYPTQFIRNVFEKSVGEKTNGYVISNGVNPAVRPEKKDKPEEFKDKIVILSIGRFSKEKSQDTLIKAIKYSKHKNDIQLILAGRGLKEKKYFKLGKKLPVPPVMKFFPREEIKDVLNFCDVYVHPAVYELEGIACLEAIVCGKLTIVSDSRLSATKNFAADQRCIFKARKPKDLARVIDRFIEHPEEKAECEKKYLGGAGEFDLDGCMRKMEQMMFSVAKKKKESLNAEFTEKNDNV